MKGFILAFSVFLLAVSLSFGEYPAITQEKAALGTQPSQTTQTIETFWSYFQTALKRRDLEKLVQLTRFPLGGDISSIVENRNVIQPEGFKRNFNALFPKVAIQSILSKSTKSLEFSTSHGEETWRFEYLETGPISEQDWAIIYTFRRLKDGKIHLTNINFAG